MKSTLKSTVKLQETETQLKSVDVRSTNLQYKSSIVQLQTVLAQNKDL